MGYHDLHFRMIYALCIIRIMNLYTVALSSYSGYTFTFTFMHLADAFIQSDLQCIQAIHFLSVCVFPGNMKLIVVID